MGAGKALFWHEVGSILGTTGVTDTWVQDLRPEYRMNLTPRKFQITFGLPHR